MNSFINAALLFTGLIAMILLGRTGRRRLPDNHLSADSKDAIKLAMGLVATMTALLLGLLVSSAKGAYDTQRTQVIQMAAKVTFLDRIFRVFGPEAAGVRAEFQSTVEEAIQAIWPEEAGRAPDLRPESARGETLFSAIQKLDAKDDAQRLLKSQATTVAMDLGQIRMLLMAQTVPSIPQPLLISVMVWLGVIFLAFSLLAPPNLTTFTSLAAAALSVAAAVFLIMELDQPLGGTIRISSAPMRLALSQFTK